MAVTNVNRFAAATSARSMFANQAAPAAGSAPAQQERAKYWLNVGFETDDPQYPFVALHRGIPLSASDKKELRGSADYVRFLDAQNSMLDEMLELAGELEPGADVIFSHPDMPLAFQIRHVRDEATPADITNPLTRKVFKTEASAPVTSPSAE